MDEASEFMDVSGTNISNSLLDLASTYSYGQLRSVHILPVILLGLSLHVDSLWECVKELSRLA